MKQLFLLHVALSWYKFPSRRIESQKTDERKHIFLGENVLNNKELIVFDSSGVFFSHSTSSVGHCSGGGFVLFVDTALFSVWI